MNHNTGDTYSQTGTDGKHIEQMIVDGHHVTLIYPSTQDATVSIREFGHALHDAWVECRASANAASLPSAG